MRPVGLTIAAAFALGGCASLDIAAREAPHPPKNHRQLVLEKSATLFPGGVTLGEMEISPLRDDEHIPEASWSACLRTDKKGKPRMFAVFFRNEEIPHVREALAVDGCERETFGPLKPGPKKRG